MSVQDAHDLLNSLRGANSTEKERLLVVVKTEIKKSGVDPDAIQLLFEALKLGIQSVSPVVSFTSLTTLANLIKRVNLQEPARLRAPSSTILPLLIERLGDVKDKTRLYATSGLVEMWKGAPMETEKAMKELGLTHKNYRIREQSLTWIVEAYRANASFMFRSFVPYMLKLLEDANEMVRETSKEVVVEMHRSAGSAAKADLKRELLRKNIRRSIATYVLSQLQLADASELEQLRAEEEVEEKPVQKRVASMGASIGTASHAPSSVAGSVASTYVGSMPGGEMEPLDPVFVQSARDLEREMQDMLPPFEGRESEHNWAQREKNCNRIRQLLRGNAYKDHSALFLAQFKTLVEGVTKAVQSLRTTLSLVGCQVVKDLAIVAGPGIDPFVDQMLTVQIKLAAVTKKIASAAAQVTTAVILANASYNVKTMQHLWFACQDKNVQPRLYNTGWLRVFLESHAGSRSQIEHTGGLEILDKIMKKALADANPQVREGMRETFWKWADIWPERVEAFMKSLDANTRKALERTNPNVGAAASSSRPASAMEMRASSRGSVRSEVGGSGSMLPPRVPQKDGFSAKIAVKKKVEGNAPPASAAPAGGLSSGPMRGLGLPQRPPSSLRKAVTSPAPTDRRPQSPSISSHATNGISERPSPSQLKRDVLSPSPSRRMMAASPRIGAASPLRHMSPTARRTGNLSVLQQLNDADPKARIDGIVTIACLFAKKTAPNAPNGQPPVLPPADLLGKSLQSLLNDPTPEVVEHLLAPEVIPELVKVVPIEQIVPRVLLMSESDEGEYNNAVVTTCLPALKQLLTREEAADQTMKTMTNMGVSGVVPRKMSASVYTMTQKRKIIHGLLTWMNELFDDHIQEKEMGGEGNATLNEEYRTWVNRIVPMIKNTKPTSANYIPLGALLKSVRRADPETFDKVLQTFDRDMVKALHKAWGAEDEDHTVTIPEEKAAAVEEVLGSVPEVGGTIQPPSSDSGMMPPPSLPVRNKSQSPPAISDSEKEKMPDFYNAPKPSFLDVNNGFDDENLTMIQFPRIGMAVPPPPPPPQVYEDKDADMTEAPSTPIQADKLLFNPHISVRKPRSTSPEREAFFSLSPEKEKNGDTLVPPQELPHIENLNIEAKPSSGPKEEVVPESSWFRRHMKSMSSDEPLPEDAEEQTKLLSALITRLKANEIDRHDYKKLQQLASQHPVRLPQNGTPTAAFDIWKAGDVYDELLSATLASLQSGTNRKSGLLLLKQLLHAQAPYLEGNEPALMKTLLDIRADTDDQHVTTGIDETMMELVHIIDPRKGTKVLLDDYLVPYTRGNQITPAPRPEGITLALNALASFLRRAPRADLQTHINALRPLTIKAMSDADPEVRRACVHVCTSMHVVWRNDRELFEGVWGALEGGKQNLLKYYFETAGEE
ncbi:suppressor of tub2 mutation [Saitoella coloradoensis]